MQPYTSQNPGKTYSILPDYTVNRENLEIANFLKADETKIEIIRFTIPKKST